MDRNKKQFGCIDLKTLNIKWQRLLNEGKTCPRCGSTEQKINKAITALEQFLTPLGFVVTLEKEELSISEFKEDPLQSNRIWINSHPLEYFINGEVGQSPCCNLCSPSDCRTINIKGKTCEAIPSDLIIKAGLTAAVQILGIQKSTPCCENN